MIPLSIQAAAEAMRAGQLTSVDLVRACLARADEFDGELGVYLARLDDTALAAAEVADAELAAGRDRGPLHGIPIGVKDIITTSDAPTTAQSLILDPSWGTQGDAPVIVRLREAGAIVLGKTSTMEFAIGMPDPSKPFPVPKNPWNPMTWPGGSSSGSGAGVAAGFFLGALGTDTGGSIRIPAAFCGISGLKATFGRVPKSGCAPLGYSLDHIGPMARTAWDCAAMLEVMAGFDASDLTCADRPVERYTRALDGSVEGLRIGMGTTSHFETSGVLPEAAAALDAAARAFSVGGAAVDTVALPMYDATRAVGTVTMRSEASSYHMVDLATRWTEYGIHTSKAVSAGAFVGAADYVQAQRVRSLARAKLAELLESHDLIITLTAGMGAPLVEGLDHNSFISWPVFTQYWNPLGLPVIAIPVGFTGDGMPLSMQIVGRPFEEARVLRAADAFQRVTDYHQQVPASVAVAV